MRVGAFAALALVLSGCAITRTYYGEPLPTYAEVLVAHASDGVDLPVIHYAPTGPRKGPPIVLCHGISANARHMDLDAEHSLARWFAARGYETFAMSLRNTYDQVLPEGSHPGDESKTNFDTYVEQDLPAVLALVRQRTGASGVDFIGHSMGGMILYAYLARGGQGIHAAVTLGSPVRLRTGSRIDPFIRKDAARYLANVDSMPNATLAALFVPASGNIETPVEKLVVNLDNVQVKTWQKLVVAGTADIAGGVLRQLAKDIVDDRFESADGKVDYLAGLAQVKVPILVVAGKADHIALPGAVKPAYEALGGPKRFFIAGVESGFARDYGHCDLTIGDRAGDELFPVLQSWFERH